MVIDFVYYDLPFVINLLVVYIIHFVSTKRPSPFYPKAIVYTFHPQVHNISPFTHAVHVKT